MYLSCNDCQFFFEGYSEGSFHITCKSCVFSDLTSHEIGNPGKKMKPSTWVFAIAFLKRILH